jgi:hypothetical protein
LFRAIVLTGFWRLGKLRQERNSWLQRSAQMLEPMLGARTCTTLYRMGAIPSTRGVLQCFYQSGTLGTVMWSTQTQREIIV